MLIKVEGVQCSVKVRGQIFNIQVNLYCRFFSIDNSQNEFISVCWIISIFREEQNTSLEVCPKYGKFYPNKCP